MICQEFYKTIGITEPRQLTKTEKIKFNKFVFENYFKPRMSLCKNTNTLIEISDNDIEFLKNFSEKKAKEKTKEWKGFDDQNRLKREMTGSLIEFGFLKLFGKEKYFDDSIVDKSYKKSYPDLLPLGIVCDIKGSSIHNVPLVFKSNRTYTCDVGKYKGKKYRCSNIIGVTDHKTVWLLGIASPKVLETYVDDNLIIMSSNTTKTGFYGVNQLREIPLDWNELKNVCSKESLVL